MISKREMAEKIISGNVRRCLVCPFARIECQFSQKEVEDCVNVAREYLSIQKDRKPLDMKKQKNESVEEAAERMWKEDEWHLRAFTIDFIYKCGVKAGAQWQKDTK